MTRDLAERHNLVTSMPKHPFDYYWRPGDELRPAPSRIRFEDIWTYSRRAQLAGWIDFHEHPKETAKTRLFADHFWQGDELMDALVARFRQIGATDGRKMFEQALEHGVETVDNPPAELTALFEQLDNPPAWYDPELVERGRQLYVDASFSGKWGMIIGDVCGTFVGDEVAYATGETGRFMKDLGRRVLETGSWFWVTSFKEGLDRNARPFKDTVRLRLMHAQARDGLRRRWGNGDEATPPSTAFKGPRGEFARHGNPISAAMIMNAALTFGVQPLLIDHMYGRKRSWADLDAVTAYWSYLAHVLGVPDELIPENAAEALEIMDSMVAHAGGPSEWTDIQVGTFVNGRSLKDRIGRLPFLFILVSVAFYEGPAMFRAMLRGTELRESKLDRLVPAYRLFVLANVGLRRLTDKIPGARWRAARRRSDWVWGSGVIVGKMLAAFQGTDHTGYRYHDATVDKGLPSSGCPVRH